LNCVSQIDWFNLPAWALEDDAIRVVVAPLLGAKIVSLFDKRCGHEWLVAPRRPYRPLAYASVFVDQDMSGWDEMFPTIDACSYPLSGAYAGARLPDHGEVWSLPWQVEGVEPCALALGVDGIALSYRLHRRLVLAALGEIRLEYHLENTGAAAFVYLWTAHPQFAAGEHTAILLPDGTDQVLNVIPGAVWGDAGEVYPWSRARSKDGRAWELDRVRSADNHDCRKFYLPPESPAAWASLVDRRLGCSVRMEWSPGELPYLGIWVDEGAYNPVPVVALEPSNGYYDSLAAAVHHRRLGSIDPGASHTWSLVVRLQAQP
jgi:galactose mutarotase-like enzyme